MATLARVQQLPQSGMRIACLQHREVIQLPDPDLNDLGFSASLSKDGIYHANDLVAGVCTVFGYDSATSRTSRMHLIISSQTTAHFCHENHVAEASSRRLKNATTTQDGSDMAALDWQVKANVFPSGYSLNKYEESARSGSSALFLHIGTRDARKTVSELLGTDLDFFFSCTPLHYTLEGHYCVQGEGMSTTDSKSISLPV